MGALIQGHGTLGTFKPIKHEIAECTCTYYVPASKKGYYLRNSLRNLLHICSMTRALRKKKKIYKVFHVFLL